ncbi:uncharacterized protein LOC131144492 [Malania oleifera]|uniref:uncharacterized protein LOC131144492 n=1 Tax=Malania oleifera TaxID=397392 RepID=UPI0025AE351A|nr:uncharacterized protein LOC131144492 [Malania oleifera]
MGCFVPFSNNSLEMSLLVFRPTVVVVDDVVDALKHFSLFSKTLGCVCSSIFKSIHGNMIVWYGAWMKASSDDKGKLYSALLSGLTDVSSMAILIYHSVFEAFAGESRTSSIGAKLSTGDTISLSSAVLMAGDLSDISYTCLALFESHFQKLEGVTAGVLLQCQFGPRIACLYVWRSTDLCYSWAINSHYRKTVLPYLDQYSVDIKYDIFRVVYVSSENVHNLHFYSSGLALRNEVVCRTGHVMQDVE